MLGTKSDSIPNSKREGGEVKKCSLLQAELKGLMSHTAYLILKMCGPCRDPCHAQISAAALSLCSFSSGERRKRTLLPWKPSQHLFAITRRVCSSTDSEL
ncbi:hypothetical protein FQA47_009961 [Oryzias melastigma]|uniref:Uncharacterized protein n=1 Tax=Oryzias melastigma TaxID=30732 RepID=A0A834FF54_ORYME|nr:hypothetical protein FQA47_009961 [Oryzias melastigma]